MFVNKSQRTATVLKEKKMFVFSSPCGFCWIVVVGVDCFFRLVGYLTVWTFERNRFLLPVVL